MSKSVEFIKATNAEMKHVTWPKRADVIAYTVVVVALSLIVAAILGVLDVAFAYLLDKLILS